MRASKAQTKPQVPPEPEELKNGSGSAPGAGGRNFSGRDDLSSGPRILVLRLPAAEMRASKAQNKPQVSPEPEELKNGSGSAPGACGRNFSGRDDLSSGPRILFLRLPAAEMRASKAQTKPQVPPELEELKNGSGSAPGAGGRNFSGRHYLSSGPRILFLRLPAAEMRAS